MIRRNLEKLGPSLSASGCAQATLVENGASSPSVGGSTCRRAWAQGTAQDDSDASRRSCKAVTETRRACSTTQSSRSRRWVRNGIPVMGFTTQNNAPMCWNSSVSMAAVHTPPPKPNEIIHCPLWTREWRRSNGPTPEPARTKLSAPFNSFPYCTHQLVNSRSSTVLDTMDAAIVG